MDNERITAPGRAQQREGEAERRVRRAFGRQNATICLAFFAIILLGFIINLAGRDRAYSTAENRPLQQRPKLTWTALTDGSWFSDMTDYYSDQFVARDSWISLHLTAQRITGQKNADDIYLGDDGVLLRAPYTPDQEAVARTVTAVNEFAEAYPDVNVSFMMVPDAASVQPQYLPANAPVRDQLTDIANFTASLSDEINVIDAAYILQQHNTEYLYYKTDHHWTSLGAYYAFMQASGTLEVTPAQSYSIYTLSDSFEGTLASESGYHRSQDTINIYVPTEDTVQYYVYHPDTGENTTSVYVSSCLDEKDQYTVFFGGNYGMLQIYTTADTGRTLLVFKDSYANSFVPFLLPYYDEIIMIDARYYYESLNTLMVSEGVTDVLYVYSADMLLTDTNLAGVLETGLPQQQDAAAVDVTDVTDAEEATAADLTDEEPPDDTESEDLPEEEAESGEDTGEDVEAEALG